MKKSDKKRILNLMTLIFSCIFLFSASMLIKTAITYQKEEKVFTDLAKRGSGTKENHQERSRMDLTSLKEENSDLWGWIRIDGTQIDYPIMWTPNDVEYYLRRDFNKNKSNAGVPFLGYDTAMDHQHLIVYAHHMHNGTMFADLLKYSDKDYWQQRHTIQLQTMDLYCEYEIFAAFESKAYASDETDVFRYYNYSDLSDEMIFEEYLTQVNEASLIESDIPITAEDDLLTLSTCRYDEKDGRFVVVAKKISEEKIK